MYRSSFGRGRVDSSLLIADERKLKDTSVIRKVKILMDTYLPCWDKYRSPNPQFRRQAEEILKQLVKYDVIAEGYSPFAAQIRWVVKAAPDAAEKEGKIPGQKKFDSKEIELRMAVDYITVNKQTSKVQYPIQPIKRILSRLRGTHVVSSIDIRKAFWNIELDEVSQKIFAFEGCEKSFLMKRLPMGSSASQQILSSCLQETT